MKASVSTDITNIATFNPMAKTFSHTENAPSVVKVRTTPTAIRKIQNMTVPFDWGLDYGSHYSRHRRQAMSFSHFPSPWRLSSITLDG